MNNDFLKSEDFLLQRKRGGRTPTARLIKLSNLIEAWSEKRFSNHTQNVVEELSIDNVQALRNLIKTEVSAIKTDDPSIVIDQILFLIVGAVKVQTQSNSDATWPLVNQTIKELASPPQKDNNHVYFALFSFLMVVGFAITIFSINNKNTPATTTLSTIEMSQAMPVNQVGSQTVDNLISVYNKMQSGECQLPQALLLQPKDREAFMAFITEGKVNINTAESLKKSLKYATCNYPQKLMNNPLNIFQDNG